MHILVVKDDPIVADILGMTSEEAGYFKTTANTIETALLGSKHNQIDAVLLDINLPDGDGTRLARLIRKNHMPVQILVVSGNSGTDDRITALGAGVDGYLISDLSRNYTKIIDVFMCKLRRKIADAGASGVVIETICGQGYILREVRDYDTMTISAYMRLIHQTQTQNSSH